MFDFDLDVELLELSAPVDAARLEQRSVAWREAVPELTVRIRQHQRPPRS